MNENDLLSTCTTISCGMATVCSVTANGTHPAGSSTAAVSEWHSKGQRVWTR